jgi:hypothetical protein
LTSLSLHFCHLGFSSMAPSPTMKFTVDSWGRFHESDSAGIYKQN